MAPDSHTSTERHSPPTSAAHRTPTDVERQSFADDDRAHSRPKPLSIPAALLYRLQSAHGTAMRYERLAHDDGDQATEATAHGLVIRLAAILWPVTV